MQYNVVRHSKEENIVLFLQQNNEVKPPIKISVCEIIIDVKKFCKVQLEIINLAISQAEYDLSVQRIILFRSAIQQK